MAVVQPYEDRVVAQGGINSQASPADFGAQVGAAVQNAGAGVEQVGQAFEAIQQDQGRIWAYKQQGDAYQTLMDGYQKKLGQLDPNDPNLSQNLMQLNSDFQDQIKQTSSDLESQAPSVYAAKVVANHMVRNQRSLMSMAAQETARVNREYTGIQIQEGMKSDQDSLAADPSNDNFTRILSNRTEQVTGFQNLPPDLKLKQMQLLKEGLAATQVQVLAATNPEGLLKSVGVQGGALTPGGKTKGAVPGGQGFGGVMDFIFSKEGGYTPSDGNGQPANFGINQGANPDIDVKSLTKDQAAQIYKQRYWNAIGGDSLPANMQLVAMNSAVNLGVGATRQMLAQAGNDPVKLTQLMKQRYQDIAAANPSKASVLPTWLQRADDALATTVGSANSSLPQVQPLTDQDIAAAKPNIEGWQYLTWQQKVQVVRQAEGVMGSKLASERGDLTRAMADIQTTLLAGKQYPNIDDPRFSQDHLTQVFGPDEGSRMYDQIQYSKQVGSFITQMSTMPSAQAQQMLMSMQPQGGPEYAKKAPVFQHATQAFLNLQKLRNDDYMNWAMNTEATGVKPVDFSNPDNFRQTLTARIGQAITGRQDYGADSHLLSKDESAQLGDYLNRLNPQDQMSYLGAVRKATIGHDDWFTDTLQQIAPKNTMLAFAAASSSRVGSVTTAAGPQSGETVGKYVLEGAHILQGKDLDDATKSGRPLSIDDNKIRNWFWQSLGTNAFASPDAQRSSQMAADTYQAVKNYLVADMYHRGVTPDKLSADLVSNAITAVTGGATKSPNGDALFVPWGMSQSQFKQQFPWALDAALVKSGLKGTSMDVPDGYHYMNVGDGKYQVTTGGKPLMGKDGRSVIVDMSRPAQGVGGGRGFTVPETNWYGGLR